MIDILVENIGGIEPGVKGCGEMQPADTLMT
jgi:hypothetical protein